MATTTWTSTGLFPTGYTLDAADAHRTPGEQPRFYECGCCGAYHPSEWHGDCREDAARLDPEDLDARYGTNGWDEDVLCERCGLILGTEAKEAEREIGEPFLCVECVA